MTMAWGPAIDAEVAYRHQQARATFHRQSARSAARQRRAAKKSSTTRIPARPDTTGWIVGRSGPLAGTPRIA